MIDVTGMEMVGAAGGVGALLIAAYHLGRKAGRSDRK